MIAGEEIIEGGVLIEGGRIAAIINEEAGDKYDEEGVEVVDLGGKLVMPGVIDGHVHFREPGHTYKEDFESGSRAAVSGGVTTVFDMPNTKPPTFSVEALNEKRKHVSGRSYVNYGFFIGFNGSNLDEINDSKNVAGVKVYCANSTGDLGVSPDFYEDVFTKINRDKRLHFHSEDEDCIEERQRQYLAEFENREIDPSVHSKIRAPECAVMMTKKLCELAKKHDRPIHICHVSLPEELQIIEDYGELVTCEVAPHHLTLSTDDYAHFGNYVRMNPPVREKMEVFGMWKGLLMGQVDFIATDHAPHTREEKEAPYREAASGVPGVEMALPIFLNSVSNEGISILEVVKLMCSAPAKYFGLKTKGEIGVGFDADIVVADMDLEKEFKDKDVVSKCGWSPYSGGVYKGWPVMTFVGGKLKYKHGKILGEGEGKEVNFE